MKRNDIGSTAARYSAAYLGETALGDAKVMAAGCDFLTVNAYLGTDGVQPFLDDCRTYDRGLFILVKTSNPSSGELQDLKLADGRTVYECMGDMVEGWGSGLVGAYGYSAVGAVVGATHPVQAKILRDRLKHTFFLIPGYGAQGGSSLGSWAGSAPIVDVVGGGKGKKRRHHTGMGTGSTGSTMDSSRTLEPWYAWLKLRRMRPSTSSQSSRVMVASSSTSWDLLY